MEQVKVKVRLEYPTQEEVERLITAIEEALEVEYIGPTKATSSGGPGNELIISETPVALIVEDRDVAGKRYVRKRYRNGRLAHYHYELEAGEI